MAKVGTDASAPPVSFDCSQKTAAGLRGQRRRQAGKAGLASSAVKLGLDKPVSSRIANQNQRLNVIHVFGYKKQQRRNIILRLKIPGPYSISAVLIDKTPDSVERID
jgi:hypothetical protein